MQRSYPDSGGIDETAEQSNENSFNAEAAAEGSDISADSADEAVVRTEMMQANIRIAPPPAPGPPVNEAASLAAAQAPTAPRSKSIVRSVQQFKAFTASVPALEPARATDGIVLPVYVQWC